MKKYIIAIDQGTTSTRAILFDKNQNIVKISQKEINNYFPNPGWVEQDANEIWLSTLSVIAQLFQGQDVKPEEVESIGITNQRETTVIWDKTTGLPVYNAIVWQSRQTSDVIDRYRNTPQEKIIKEKTGLVLDPYFSASKIRWILENVDALPPIENLLFGTIDTWLVWKMTNGTRHVTDVTNASRTLLFNVHTLEFDDELLNIFDVPKSMLPKIVDTSCIIGNIEPMFFFNQTCSISAIVGDQQSALFGQSCFKRGDVKNTYGTGGFLLINTGENPIISSHGLLSTVAWRIDGKVNYALEGSIFVSGSLIQWLRDGLKLFSSASQTEELATSVDSCNGVIVVPAFTGLGAPYWNENCRGAIFGLTRGVDIRHIVRASLESMAYQSKDLIVVMEEELNEKIESIKVDGGASENNFLLQFQSDILEIPVIRSKFSETTALGAARLAGLSTGFYSMEDFKEENTTIFNPQREHDAVEKIYSDWKRAVESCMKY